MANVNDTNNTLGKLEREWEKLYNADIDDRDRQMIEEFVRFERKGNQNRKPNTLISDLGVLRRASERAETPLVDMEMTDVRSFLGVLTRPKSQDGYGLAANGSGVFGYKRGLRVFFEWLDEEPQYGDFGFYDDIELPSQRAERVSEGQTLDEDDVKALKAAAKNPRDSALIDFLADTAARVSLASQLRVGDVYDLETDRPYYKPNPNGENHKDAPNKQYPILYSQAELRSYVNAHHIDHRAEAPLWHVLTGYDFKNPQDSAMSGDRIRAMLRECAKRAGVTKPVNPHNFRHTAITRLSKTGHTRKEIQHVAGWADDRMLDRYDHTTDQERNDQLRARAGFIDEVDAGTEPAQAKSCGNCREKLGPGTRFCPNCGAATTEKARERLDDQNDRFFESATMAQGELAEAVLEFRRLADEYPILRAAMLES